MGPVVLLENMALDSWSFGCCNGGRRAPPRCQPDHSVGTGYVHTACESQTPNMDAVYDTARLTLCLQALGGTPDTFRICSRAIIEYRLYDFVCSILPCLRKLDILRNNFSTKVDFR